MSAIHNSSLTCQHVIALPTSPYTQTEVCASAASLIWMIRGPLCWHVLKLLTLSVDIREKGCCSPGFRTIAVSLKCARKLAEAPYSLIHPTSPVLTNKLKPALCLLTPDQAGQGSSTCPVKAFHADTPLQQLLGPPYHLPRPSIWGQLHIVTATLAGSQSAPDVLVYF